MKYVYQLARDEERNLRRIVRTGPSYRTRIRAHAILLSHKKFPIDQLSTIFEVHRDTISRWIDVWFEKGISGLFDAPKPGRPKMKRDIDEDDE